MNAGNGADWAPLLEQLAERRAAARAMGGADKLARYRATGRLDARSRVSGLLDPESFVELGPLTGDPAIPADAFVAGSGTIDGRPVMVGAEDFTVAGGSIGTTAASKRTRAAQLALRNRTPLVMMLEGAGHRATNALERNRPAPNDLQAMADLSGLVPTVAIVTGPSAGHGALAAPLSDFVIMVGGHGALFTAGPPLVAASTGEQIDKQTLGGPQVAIDTSGVAHNLAESDDAALALARRYLSYFPSSAWQRPPWVGPDGGNHDVGERALPELLDLVPVNQKRPYDMQAMLAAVADAGTVTEIQPTYGTSIITALVRIGGHAVAVVANQPTVTAGAVTVAAADKAAAFLQLAGAFHLPVLFLADNPGVMAGSASEKAGILKASARMFAAQHRLRTPKFHVTVRKAFGFGSSVMGANPYDNQTMTLAFPAVTLGGIPADVGGRTAKEDDDTRRALVENEASGPWALAQTLFYDDVIDPRELRNILLRGLDGAVRGGAAEPVAHHGYLR
ncbi:acetyl-CoA carboxylase carboxyltransferase subunit [Prescottella equi]|uniref:acyl-CoA carboxylase subunit beta n=1 Tax=Rhodococcus hoagii TaxID=43767 RepID=UPI000A0F8859|nr:carboxyl transferase domain-containing protein [Prescottella equi]ORL02021.1 acetyl-CoA carboxylase carboxyltransferase subunit [Prescottella equi]